jgi:hypothetical protein
VFLADPFPIAREDGVTRLLAEEYDRGAARGRIVALHTGDGGDVRSRTVWMDAGHHLSYPFVFTAGGAAQCIPEAASTRRVTSYDLDSRTPHVLIDRFAAADPTITEHEDHWYLFCTNRDDEPQTDLHLFVAENWRGPWRPHPRNPVKSDARSSRPAGACFRLADALFRPAQDCSRRYGGGLVINRVTALSPTMFREQTVCTLDADAASPWPHGVHTINGCGPVTWVDGLRVDGL